MLRRRAILSCCIAVFCCSCNIMRYVPEGETLLNKVTIKSNVPEATSDHLQSYLRQTPNSRFLGIGRAKLGIYSAQDVDSERWKDRWFRKMGEEPVIYDSLLTESSQEQLTKELENKGYWDATVEVFKTEKSRKTDLTFVVTGNEPYRIKSYKIDIPDDSVMYYLNRRKSTLPKPGDLFDADMLSTERENAARSLRRKGYYYIQKEALRFEADSANHEVDITLKLQDSYNQNDSIRQRLFTKQTISSVTIYDISKSMGDDGQLNRADLDTTTIEGFTIIHSKKGCFRPKALISKVLITPKECYNERRVERTYAILNSLQATKYVDISFRETANDSLACAVVVAPSKKHSFSVDLEGTNSAGDLGIGLGVTYQNKNAFKGAEVLKVGARGSYEAMGKIGALRNAYEVGGNVSITVPELLMPLKTDTRRRMGGTTEFSIGYNFQQRPEYKRNIANLGMKYAWSVGRTRFVFDLIDINYIYLPWISDTFREQYLKPSSSIRYSYEDHFIMRLGLGVQNSNKRTNSSATQSFYTLRSNVSTAGNLLYGISNAIGQKKSDDGQYHIFNIAYSQYVKGDFDFTYNQYINKKMRLVFHGGIGVAFPYGNASIIPYEERYFSGGANSVRGWAVRTLGPGRYANNGDIDYMNQSGDIRLDLNVEMRFKLFWKIYGALFVDAGNIWTIKDYDEQPGGYFQFSTFYKEIACSYGIGIRADFDYFVLRLDMGVKLYEPSGTTTSERWRTDLTWKNDFALHFAVGYPF